VRGVLFVSLTLLALMLAISALTGCDTLFAPKSSDAAAGSRSVASANVSAGGDAPGTEFAVDKWEAISELDPEYRLPRAYIVLHFASAMPVLMTLTGPDGGTLGLTQEVSADETVAKLPMTPSFLTTPKPGRYVLSVTTGDGTPLAEEELDFRGASLRISGVPSSTGDGDYPDTLRVGVVNRGDLPAYVVDAQVWIASIHPAPSCDARAVQPGESATLTFHWDTEGGCPPTSATGFHLRLLDGAGGVVLTHGDPPDEWVSSASFQVKGWQVASEPDTQSRLPRSYLVLDFASEIPVSLTLLDPRGKETGAAARVTESVTRVHFPMTVSPVETPLAGRYTLSVKNWTGDLLKSVEIAYFEGARLAVSGISLVPRGTRVPYKLEVDFTNQGDLPVYIDSAVVRIDAATDVVPCEALCVMAEETTVLLLEWLSDNPPPDPSTPNTVEITFKDGANAVQVQYQTRVQLDMTVTHVSENLPFAVTHPVTWTFTEGSAPGGYRTTIRSPGGDAWVQVDAQRAAGCSLSQWVNINNTSRVTEWLSYDITSQEQVDWWGQTGHRLTWIACLDTPNKLIQVTELCLAWGEWKYSIQATALLPVYPEYAAKLDLIVDRFALFAD